MLTNWVCHDKRRQIILILKLETFDHDLPRNQNCTLYLLHACHLRVTVGDSEVNMVLNVHRNLKAY